jgi:hypothetical protein
MADLTVEARDDEVLEAILFSTTVYSAQINKRASPRDRVLALSSMPETVLQAIAAAFCGFPHTAAPEILDGAPYEQYFGRDNYRHPDKGSKLDLTGLLVLVPIHLRIRFPGDDKVTSFCEPKKVVSTMGRLVDQIRNVTAHSYGVFTDSDAAFTQQISSELLDLLAHLAGHGSAAAFVASLGQPGLDELDQVLGGETPPATESETA